MKTPSVLPRRRQGGIAMVEALVAVFLLAVGLFGAMGLQAKSGSALADAGMRAEATMAADKLLGTMAVDLPNVASYALAASATPTPGARLLPWYNDTRARIPNASVVIGITSAAGRTRVEITIGWARKTGAATNTHHIVSYLAAAT